MELSNAVIRPQSLLVLALLVAVILWGARSAGSGMDTGNPTPTLEPVDIAVAPSTASPAKPPVSRPTREPSSTPRPTEEPTPSPTEAPVQTPRPPAPDTGLDGTSLIVERGESGRREVAFTFDAGEGAGHTAEILDILEEFGVKGSFGVTGEWVEQNPELARRIVDDGHMLINHTYDHRSWTGESTGGEPLTADERLSQVQETERIIEEVTGYETAPYFRFPYGAYDRAALDVLAEAGYDYTLWWTCDTLGWDGNSGEEIVELCGPDAEKGGPGAIILMHVVTDGDLAALPGLIEEYIADDYKIVTMEQMIQP